MLLDSRQQGKVDHSIDDVVMCAFAIMHFQDPLLLQFQKRMEEARQTNNLKALFLADSLPKDTQIREFDEVDPSSLEGVFTDYFARLQQVSIIP